MHAEPSRACFGCSLGSSLRGQGAMCTSRSGLPIMPSLFSLCVHECVRVCVRACARQSTEPSSLLQRKRQKSFRLRPPRLRESFNPSRSLCARECWQTTSATDFRRSMRKLPQMNVTVFPCSFFAVAVSIVIFFCTHHPIMCELIHLFHKTKVNADD